MSRFKTFLWILVLVLITASVVFVPVIVNADSNRLTRGRTYWSYNAEHKSKITSRQVADLYYNGEINNLFFKSVQYEKSEARDSFYRILDTVFSENEELCGHLKETADYELLDHSRFSILMAVDNNPVALNFINISYVSSFNQIEITYEEKTQTVIYFYYQSIDEKSGFLNLQDAIMFHAKNYYQNVLQLSEDRYFFENNDNWTGFGLEWFTGEYTEKDILDTF